WHCHGYGPLFKNIFEEGVVEIRRVQFLHGCLIPERDRHAEQVAVRFCVSVGAGYEQQCAVSLNKGAKGEGKRRVGVYPVEYDDVSLIEQAVIKIPGGKAIVVKHLTIAENLSNGCSPVVGFDFQHVDALVVVECQVKLVIETDRHVVKTHLGAIKAGEARRQIEGDVPHGACRDGYCCCSRLDAVDGELDVELFAFTITVVAHPDGEGISFLPDRERVVEVSCVDEDVVIDRRHYRNQVPADTCIGDSRSTEGRLLEIGNPEHLLFASRVR